MQYNSDGGGDDLAAQQLRGLTERVRRIPNAKLKESRFFDFVERVSSGAVRLENNQVIEVEGEP